MLRSAGLRETRNTVVVGTQLEQARMKHDLRAAPLQDHTAQIFFDQ
jgi:hypothetical protein